jgi:hypothetical protein
MNSPSQFQKPRGDGLGYEITGGYSSVNGEGRRRLLIRELDRVLSEQGWPDISVDPDAQPGGGVSYKPDVSAGYEDSIVRVDLLVPTFLQPSGKDRIEMNVPPGQNWSQAVLEIVLVFVANWARDLVRP